MSGLNMTDPMPDIPRLRKAVEWVEEQAARPEVEREWRQVSYRSLGEDVGRTCGTTYCVAGKVCEDAGVEWAGESSGVLANGDHAAETARDLLGITQYEACNLFEMLNDPADVRRVAESIAARVGERL